MDHLDKCCHWKRVGTGWSIFEMTEILMAWGNNNDDSMMVMVLMRYGGHGDDNGDFDDDD